MNEWSTPLTSSSSPSPVSMKSPLQLNQVDSLTIKAVTDLINDMIHKNTKKVKKIKKNKFFSSTIPVMNVYEYILRIVRYTNIESNTLIAAMISLTSYIHRNKISLCYNNIHRLFLASCYLNAKYHQDINFSLKLFAKVGGVTSSELKELEIEFYAGINYSLDIKESVFKQYSNLIHR